MNVRRIVNRGAGVTRRQSGAATKNTQRQIAGAILNGWASTSPTGRYQIRY